MPLPQAESQPAADTDVLAFPASVAQQMFWYLELLQGTVTAFNVPLRFNLAGPLDIRLMERAFNALIERHEILRTCFGEEDGELLQIVSPKIELRLAVIDISHFPAERIDDEANRLGSIEAHRPFDLATAPLLRAEILRLAPDRHILHFTVHHALFDGMSMGIFGREIAELYQALFEKRTPRLEPLAIQYGDYSVWQKGFLDGPRVKSQLDYWKRKLDGMTEVNLPTDFPRPPVKSWKGDITSRLLPKELSAKLQTIAASQGATLFHVHLAAFMLLLHRYSGDLDIAVGAPVVGRSGGDLEALIGVFINTLILRTDLSGDPTFLDFLTQVRDMSLEALENQELPFETLVAAMRPQRDPSRNPLFQVNFNHHRSFTMTEKFGGVEMTTVPSRSPGAIFDLHLFLVERDEGWRASLDFCTELITRETADSMLGHLQTLFEDIAAHPEKPIGELEILTPAERQRLSSASSDGLLLDAFQRLVPVGVPGELCSVASGELLETKVDGDFIDHPEFGRLLRTGDICRRTPDGKLEFLHRKNQAPAALSAKPAPKSTPARPVSVGTTVARLTGIWEELLGTTGISPNDDFFDIGGHSLMTLRMFSRIHREFGNSLPLATLLKYPTIAQLATQLTPAAAEEPAAPATPSKSNIITLTPGGEETPLFCLHGGDGGVIFYRELANRMPSDIPFHAIESLELGNSGPIAPTSIEETATCYLQDLLTVQPHGPFRLAGYSFGGVVAHEIACQLQDRGETVELLAMFDTDNPTAPVRCFCPIERLSVFWKSQRHVPFFARLGRLRARFCEGIHTNRRIRAELKKAKESSPGDAYSDLRRVQVREENWRAMQAYRPRHFNGKISLFKSTHVSDKFDRLADYGWRSVAGGGLEILPVGGEHLELFDAEHVAELADSLARALANSTPSAGVSA